jgi:hypothetical protein
MDKTMLLMMLAQQVPQLLERLGPRLGGGLSQNLLGQALERGYDLTPIQDDLDSAPYPANAVISNLGPLVIDKPMPLDRDYAVDELPYLVEKNNELGFYHPAAQSAFNMFNDNPNIGLDSEEIPMELPTQNDVVPGTNIPRDDRDMDELHSTEMWDSGANYQKKDKLKDWYKKNRR